MQNYTGGAETDDSDVATQYSYDGDNHVVLVQADESGGTVEQTAYVYGVSTASGSAINSNDLLAAVEYADPSTGLASSSDEDAYTYNALGQQTTFSDPNGNVHQYSYDALGRLTSDAVTTLGTGVDGSVRRIDYAYDSQGNQYLITSYDAVTGGDVVNQVLQQYNGLGQLTAEYQQQGGAVDTSTSPVVSYVYSEMVDGSNASRLESVTYPDGYQVEYNYGSSGSLDDTISRLSSISDSTGTLESYQYLGLDTVVVRAQPQAETELTYVSQDGSTGDAGDQYTGLDRFGRVVEQLWVNTSTGATVAGYQYRYDGDNNVLSATDLVDAALSQLYSYNALNELVGYEQGTLNTDGTALVGSATASQSWDVDAVGNLSSTTTNGVTQTQSVNQQNEITGLSGGGTVSYDANGNLTADGAGNSYVYDAWGRLVSVSSGGSVLSSYSYNGLGQRISQTSGGVTTQFVVGTEGQVLEETVAGVVMARNVWSLAGVNVLVLRDQSSAGDGVLDQRLFFVQDVSGDVTALVGTSGAVVERYAYSPYGQVTVLAPDFTVRSSSAYNAVYLWQGGRLDSATGLYHFGARDYSPTLQRWVEADPLGRAGSGTNLYQAMGGNPTNETDLTGLYIILDQSDVQITNLAAELTQLGITSRFEKLPGGRYLLNLGANDPSVLNNLAALLGKAWGAKYANLFIDGAAANA